MKLFQRTDLSIVLTGLMIAYAMTLLATDHTVAELATHFMPHYAAASAIAAFGLWRCGAKGRSLLALALCIAFLLPVIPLSFSRQVARSYTYEDLSILQFNVNYANDIGKGSGWWNNLGDADRLVLRLVSEEQPDIVLLQEVSPSLADKITALGEAYPYHMLAPKAGAFGMVIYSRVPILSSERLKLEGAKVEYSKLELQTPKLGLPVTLYEVHLRNPLQKVEAELRDVGLASLGTLVGGDQAVNRLLIGDLNLTPYSPYYNKLEHETGLKNSMRGISISGTWPSFLPVPLRLPIDHLLLPETMDVLERRVLGHYGSDHLPVLTRLRLYKPE